MNFTIAVSLVPYNLSLSYPRQNSTLRQISSKTYTYTLLNDAFTNIP